MLPEAEREPTGDGSGSVVGVGFGPQEPIRRRRLKAAGTADTFIGLPLSGSRQGL